jgi:hypothetical protein
MTSPSNHAGAPASSAILHSFDDWLCGGVAARGRAASPTKRGRYCLDLTALFKCSILERVQVSRTSSERPIEDYRTAPLFDSPKKDQRD